MAPIVSHSLRIRMPTRPAEFSHFDPRRRAWWRRAIRGHNGRSPRMKENRQQRIEHFNSHVYGHVEGWLGDRMWQIVNVIGTILDTNGVCGNIAEFGVHHGL